MNKMLDIEEPDPRCSSDQRYQNGSGKILRHEFHKRNVKLGISKFLNKKNLFFLVSVIMIIPLVNGCATMTKVLEGVNTTLEAYNSLQNGRYFWEEPGSQSTSSSSAFTSSTYLLTVYVRGGDVFNLRVNVINAKNIISYGYVSNSSPECAFTIPKGSYLVELKIGSKTLSQTLVNLNSNKSITLSAY